VAGLRVALDAEEGGAVVTDEADDRLEVDPVEHLLGVAAGVHGRQLGARAFALAAPLVLAVLQLPHLGRRRQLRQVAVADARLAQRRLEALRVRPGVLAAAHAAPLAHVEDDPDLGLPQGPEEAGPVKAVDADRGELRQDRRLGSPLPG
jgi:hypothetical protein